MNLTRKVCQCLNIHPAVIENEINIRLDANHLSSPKALYLYGSRAKGTCDPATSDVDVYAPLPTGPATETQQDELDQWTQTEIEEGEIEEGPNELDINIVSPNKPSDAISFTEVRKRIRECRQRGFIQ